MAIQATLKVAHITTIGLCPRNVPERHTIGKRRLSVRGLRCEGELDRWQHGRANDGTTRKRSPAGQKAATSALSDGRLVACDCDCFCLFAVSLSQIRCCLMGNHACLFDTYDDRRCQSHRLGYCAGASSEGNVHSMVRSCSYSVAHPFPLCSGSHH